MRKFSKKVLALAIVFSLGLSGMSISEKASANENRTGLDITNIMDKTASSIFTPDGYKTIYDIGSVTPTVCNIDGSVITNNKLTTVFNKTEFKPLFESCIDSGPGFGFRYTFNLDSASTVDLSGSMDIFDEEVPYEFSMKVFISEITDELGYIVFNDDEITGRAETDITYKIERDDCNIKLEKGTYYISYLFESDDTYYYADFDEEMLEYPTLEFDIRKINETAFSNKIDIGNGHTAYQLVPNTSIRGMQTFFENSRKMDVFVVYDAPQNEEITINATSSDALCMSLLNESYISTDMEAFYDDDLITFSVKAGRNLFKISGFNPINYLGNTNTFTLTLTDCIVESEPTPTPTYNPTNANATLNTNTNLDINNLNKLTNTNTNTTTQVSTKKTMPYISTQFVGKSLKKIRFTVSNKLKGVTVKFKWKGKTYKTKTNKKGIATITVKKKFINGKKIKVTYSKNGYKTKTNTYKISILRF